MIKHYEFYEAIINTDEYFNESYQNDSILTDYGDYNNDDPDNYSYIDFTIDDLKFEGVKERKFRIKWKCLFDKLTGNIFIAEKGKDNGIDDLGLFEAVKIAITKEWDEDFVKRAEIKPINDHICIVEFEETSIRDRVKSGVYTEEFLENTNYPDFREETIYVVQIEEIK